MFDIRLAESQEDLVALYRFRYKIYVEEMGRVKHDADHVNKRIVDELDEGANNLVAYKKGQIVGAARVKLNETITPFYRDFYKILDQVGTATNNISIVTRLMLAPEVRKSTLTYRLFIACYEFGLWRGTKFNFVDCNDHLIDLFMSFGCSYYIGKVTHPEYGLVNPLIINLHDETNLRITNSPFLDSFLRLKSEQIPSKIDNHQSETEVVFAKCALGLA